MNNGGKAAKGFIFFAALLFSFKKFVA